MPNIEEALSQIKQSEETITINDVIIENPEIINLTADTITVLAGVENNSDGTINHSHAFHLPPSGTICRVSTIKGRKEDIHAITIERTSFMDFEGLPEPKKNTIYVVYPLIAPLIKGRNDVYTLGEKLVDEQGNEVYGSLVQVKIRKAIMSSKFKMDRIVRKLLTCLLIIPSYFVSEWLVRQTGTTNVISMPVGVGLAFLSAFGWEHVVFNIIYKTNLKRYY
jgi:hypothetical protein